MKKEPRLNPILTKGFDGQRTFKVFSNFFINLVFFLVHSQIFETYTEAIAFELTFKNMPVAVVPQLSHSPQVETTLSATGFQFLYYRFIDKTLNIDLAEAQFENGKVNVLSSGTISTAKSPNAREYTNSELFPAEIEFDYQRQLSKRLP